MKQKIIFYLLIFSILINLYLISDYGKRLEYSGNKIEVQAEKILKLKDSIQTLNSKLKVDAATIP